MLRRFLCAFLLSLCAIV
uniref:Uncharacterized protein n=1 Tax=Rhizophora mucronata TaxID=61149 RepID=A0A2P2QA76_RHIMU